MLSLILSIVLGVFAGMLLKGFYSMVKIEEPASYTYSVSKLERSRGKVAAQYIGFRTIPVFVATLGVVVTARRLMLYDWATFFACVLSFVCLSSGRALVERIKNGMRDAPFHCFVLIVEIARPGQLGRQDAASLLHLCLVGVQETLPETIGRHQPGKAERQEPHKKKQHNEYVFEP